MSSSTYSDRSAYAVSFVSTQQTPPGSWRSSHRYAPQRSDRKVAHTKMGQKTGVKNGQQNTERGEACGSSLAV
eukprot:735582-Prymnesium_polylepis.1